MCSHCGFGPLDFYACSNLSTHQNERVGKHRIRNECPHCEHFHQNIRQWKRWDGRCAGSPESVEGVAAASTPEEDIHESEVDTLRCITRELGVPFTMARGVLLLARDGASGAASNAETSRTADGETDADARGQGKLHLLPRHASSSQRG